MYPKELCLPSEIMTVEWSHTVPGIKKNLNVKMKIELQTVLMELFFFFYLFSTLGVLGIVMERQHASVGGTLATPAPEPSSGLGSPSTLLNEDLGRDNSRDLLWWPT